MGKVFCSVAISLDGYAAAKDGDLSWLNDAMAKGEDYGFAENTRRTGAYIVGANTYREMLKTARPGKDKTPTYVFSHDKQLPQRSENVVFLSGDLAAEVETVRSSTEKDVYLFGGPTLAAAFIDANLLDELAIAIIPVLLGGGTPFFGRLLDRKRLVLSDLNRFEKSGIVSLNYRLNPRDSPARTLRARRMRT
jgi:dihydrofolate reductase